MVKAKVRSKFSEYGISYAVVYRDKDVCWRWAQFVNGEEAVKFLAAQKAKAIERWDKRLVSRLHIRKIVRHV